MSEKNFTDGKEWMKSVVVTDKNGDPVHVGEYVPIPTNAEETIAVATGKDYKKPKGKK